jgi:hypothetical protein
VAGLCSFRVAPVLAVAFAIPGTLAGPAAANSPASLTQRLQLAKLKLEVQQLRDDARDQHRKLNLEVTKLEQDTSLVGQARPWAPLAAVAVAIVGGAWALWRYLRERRAARRLSLEEGLTRNLDRLTDFPEGKPFATATTALRNLAALTSEPISWWRTLLDAARGELREPILTSRTGFSSRLPASIRRAKHRDRVTQALVTMVTSDLTFATPAHLRFATVCVTDWEPYRELARHHAALVEHVLFRLTGVLSPLGQRSYFLSVDRDRDGNYFPRDEEIPDADFTKFRRAVEAYETYVGLLTKDDGRKAAADDFERALGNPRLRRTLFGDPPAGGT